MESISAKISSKYQIVIPKEVRETLNLHPSDTLLFLIDGHEVYLRPKPNNFTETLQGLHRNVWTDEAVQRIEKDRGEWT